MSVDALARFALSHSGKVYAESCRYFGVDPAGILDEDDDVIALGFRAALMYASVRSAESPDSRLTDDQLLRSLGDVERAMQEQQEPWVS